MSNTVTTEDLKSVGFVRCDPEWIEKEGYEIWFYERLDYWVHFDGGVASKDKTSFHSSADCSLPELIERLIDYHEDSLWERFNYCGDFD